MLWCRTYQLLSNLKGVGFSATPACCSTIWPYALHGAGRRSCTADKAVWGYGSELNREYKLCLRQHMEPPAGCTLPFTPINDSIYTDSSHSMM